MPKPTSLATVAATALAASEAATGSGLVQAAPAIAAVTGP